jgi:hypothetical protein
MSEAETYKVLLEINKNLGSLNSSVITIDEKLDRACDSITQHDKALVRHENDIHQLKEADNGHKATLARIERILTKDMIPFVQTVKQLKARPKRPVRPIHQVPPTAPVPALPPNVAYSPPDASFWQRLPTYGKVIVVAVVAIAGIVAGILTFISGVM